MLTKNTQGIESSFRISLTNALATLSVSDDVDELLGFNADDFRTGRVSLQSLVHAHDQDIVDVLFSTAINPSSGTFNIRLRHFNGRICCIKGEYSKSFEGEDAGVILNLRLQDAKSIREPLSTQPLMTNFKAMMENADDYIYFKDRNHVFTGASQALVEITESTQHWSDLIGMTDYDVFAEEYADIYYRLEKQVFAGVQVAHDIQETLNQDGSKGWINNRNYPIRNEAGEIIGLFGIARNITEQKLAEQALRDSEASLRESQLIAGLGDYVLDIQSGLWTSSEILDQILGIDAQYDRTEKGWDALIHPEDRPKAKHYLRRRFAAKCPTYDREYRIIRQTDQAVRYIRGLGRLVLDEQGQPLRMHGTIQDVTSSRQELLAEKRAILGNRLIGIITVKDQKVVWANAAFEAMLGYAPDELVGVPTLRFYANVDDYQASIDHEGIAHALQEFVRKDGRRIWVDMSTARLHQEASESLWALVDVTERKLAENDLRIAATAFESQEGMLVTDANNNILRVNRAFTNITGYSSEEVVGQQPRMFNSGQHDVSFFVRMWECINNAGVWEGEILNRRKNGEVYPEYLTITAVKNTEGMVTNYVATLTDITERKQAADEIRHLAFYDSLTHLPNRRLLLNRLNHALAASARSGRAGALLFLDLDHFKILNDTLGHATGDLLLQQVSARLSACVREGDTVARLGGDEFVVLLEDISASALEVASRAEVTSEKILSALGQTYKLGTHEYQSTVSIGVAIFSGHEQTQEELLKHADIAMYQAKKANRNTLRFFDPKMQEAIHARVDLERELRKALEQHQFRLYYQIQVDVAERPIGAEALIRWIHPERGLVSPLHFIPLAEETGLILPIGKWVLDAACAQLQIWQQDVATRNLTISINVSAKQFRQADFVDEVLATMQRHAIDPAKLKLELTESMLLDDIENTVATMAALGKLGVQFSLDDFGTGYSSLQYLKRLPLAQLKIDQSFVRDIAINSNDQAIVRTIIAMAHMLNLNVIAEGVEAEVQQGLLLNDGCICYQGFLFGKPVPIDQFEAALNLEGRLEVMLN